MLSVTVALPSSLTCFPILLLTFDITDCLTCFRPGVEEHPCHVVWDVSHSCAETPRPSWRHCSFDMVSVCTLRFTLVCFAAFFLCFCSAWTRATCWDLLMLCKKLKVQRRWNVSHYNTNILGHADQDGNLYVHQPISWDLSALITLTSKPCMLNQLRILFCVF